ncbi:MAG: ABC transporter ATP-binding protein [Candidatus Hadarchaeum sp.]|uniref:ABC transporter ATP-binding protein n=1 Tax=Candidatus Hadarchaeum sp. TaxID=2883567 RepID=UPI0031721358
MKVLLSVKNINVSYGKIPVLYDVSLQVGEKEVVTVVGPNGAGKTTLLRAISGLVPISSGSITFKGMEISRLRPHEISKLGISHVLEGKRIFPNLTVKENLYLGAFKARERIEEGLKLVYDLFPRLKERENQRAGTLSGGERQMLVVGQGLMSNPSLLMLDEPSLGIAPKLIEEIFEVLKMLKKQGVTILLVEQFVAQALALADRGYVLENGRICLSGSGKGLCKNRHVKTVYLGGK